MIIPNTCKVPRISIKRWRRDGVEGVARLELTELVGTVARLRYLFEPTAGGRGVAETVGESTRASSSTVNGRPGWPHCGTEVSTTTFPCALHCPAWRLADVFDACGCPRVQEMVSEDSWQLFFRRRTSTPWSSFGRRGSQLSAMRARGGLRMSGMGSGDLCEGPCRLVHAVCVLASASSRKCDCGFSRILCAIVTFVISVLPACRIESMPIP
jgi:hypothetical protein